MNFWVSSVIYHSSVNSLTYLVSKFLFRKLELNKIYCFTKLDLFINVLKKLITLHLGPLKKFITLNFKHDMKIFFVDWFFCLICDKIPLKLSADYL